MPLIRILLADDHTVLRAGLKALLSGQPDMEIVGEAADGVEALEATGRLTPDVLLADIGMPRMTGLELARRVKQAAPSTRVLILTVHEDQTFLQRALRAGADGYLVKHAAEEELLAGIRAVARGEAFLLPSMTRGLIEEYVRRSSRRRPKAMAKHGEAGLTPREVQVLRCIAQGYSNAQIAEKFVISIKTVESHRASIMGKLGARTRVDLVRYALEQGLLAEGGGLA